MTNRIFKIPSKTFSFLQILGLSVLLILMVNACSIKMNPADTGDLKTYYIPQFTNNAPNTLPNLPIQLTEALKDKVRLQSTLKYTDENPDIELRGTLVDFRITSEAPRIGETTAINRLTITLAIEYFNNRTQKEVWKRNFSFFYNYDSNQDFSTVQEIAIRTISNQLMEDIFNAAFSDW
jgi:hypothetical protein